MTSRRKTNKNVSVSSMTGEDRQLISNLIVKNRVPSQHGNSKSSVWQYFGNLYCKDTDTVFDEDRYFCRVCLEDLQKLPGNSQHISSVQSYKASTSTANMISHLAVKHDLQEIKEETMNRVTKYFKAYTSPVASTSKHEFNRDLALWFCRDLLPFDLVEKRASRTFWQKIYRQLICLVEPPLQVMHHWMCS
jgi:hypothetical protein